MSKDFEASVVNSDVEDQIQQAILKDRQEQKALAEQERLFQQQSRLLSEEVDDDYYDPSNPLASRAKPSTTTFNLREEVDSQLKLLKSIREHFFYDNGTPREDTEASDITSYMSNTTKLLAMLKGFEESLKTDADVLKIETAIEMALEDSPCQEFIVALSTYLEQDIL